jgi:hypothetical protein
LKKIQVIDKTIKNEQGFIVSVTAVIVACILGSFVMYFSNSISLNTTNAANSYSSSQARWSAYSGIEDAFMTLSTNGSNDMYNTYPFYGGDITINMTTIDPVNRIHQIISRGTHANSNRLFSVLIQEVSGDGPSYFEEKFEDGDDQFVYQPLGSEDGDGTYWGWTCDGDIPEDMMPQYILDGAEGCYFLGVPQVHPGEILVDDIEIYEYDNLMLSVWLAAGVDVPEVENQSIFGDEDYLQVLINDHIMEEWRGPSAPGGPMSPQVGNVTGNLTPNYQEFTWNLTEIFGEMYEDYEEDEFDFEIEVSVGDLQKYIGIDNVRLWEFEGGGGGWEIVPASFTEI